MHRFASFLEPEIPYPDFDLIPNFGKPDHQLWKKRPKKDKEEFVIRPDSKTWDLDYILELYDLHALDLQSLSKIKASWVIRQKFKVLIHKWHPDHAGKREKSKFETMSKMLIFGRDLLEKEFCA